MFSLIGYGLLGIVVAIGVVALLVLVLPADHLAAAPRDVVPSGLPARPEITAADVTRVRLPVTLRGYRMVDTDAVLDRLAIELLRREEEIDELRRAAGLGPRPTWPDAHSYDGGLDGSDEVLAAPPDIHLGYASVGSTASVGATASVGSTASVGATVEAPYAAGEEGTHPVGPTETYDTARAARHASNTGAPRENGVHP